VFRALAKEFRIISDPAKRRGKPDIGIKDGLQEMKNPVLQNPNKAEGRIKYD
jgi:hypothetical protein